MRGRSCTACCAPSRPRPKGTIFRVCRFLRPWGPASRSIRWLFARRPREEGAVNREEKAVAVAALQERFQRATVTLLASSSGLTVGKMQQLRRALRQVGGEYKITKNTFAKRAVKDT